MAVWLVQPAVSLVTSPSVQYTLCCTHFPNLCMSPECGRNYTWAEQGCEHSCTQKCM